VVGPGGCTARPGGYPRPATGRHPPARFWPVPFGPGTGAEAPDITGESRMSRGELPPKSAQGWAI
jgi:hypothetical protein